MSGLGDAISKLGKDRNLILIDSEIKEIITYIDRISNYLGERATHLMMHCNRKTLRLCDIKNASRIELKEELIQSHLKYSNYIVTRYFEIRKGYSIELLNHIFNYEKLCPSKILLEMEIYLPFNYFRDKLKLLNTYQVKYESTIFLIAMVQSTIITILNSLLGNRITKPKTPIGEILNNYKCHSDIIW